MGSTDAVTAGPRVMTLRWGTGAFCIIVGALMLVVPHQFATPAYAAFQPRLSLWGLVFLLAGAGLIDVATTVLRRPLVVLAHALATIALLALAAGFAAVSGWTGTALYSVLALASLVGAVADTTTGRALLGRADLFGLALGLAALLNGIVILGLPGQFGSPIFDPIRPYLTYYGLAFLVGGTALTTVQLRPGAPRWQSRAAHTLAAVAFFAYVLGLALPIQAWTAVAAYGGFGAILLVRPWLEQRKMITERSMRTRLVLALAGITTFALVAVLTIVTEQSERQSVARELEQQEVLAASVAREVADFVRLNSSAAHVLAAQPDILARPSAEQRAILQDTMRAYPDIAALLTVDATGQALARNDDAPLISYAENPVFQRARDTGRPSLAVAPSVLLGRPVFAFAAPVVDADGRIAGQVAGSLDSVHISDRLAQAGGRTRTLYLIDERGRVIAHPDPAVALPLTDLSGTEPVGRALVDADGVGSLQHGTGAQARLVAFARVPEYSWHVLIERPLATALMETYSGREVAFGVLLIALAAVVLLGLSAASRLLEPLAGLAQAANRLAAGDRSHPLPRTDITEVAALSGAFAEMRDNLAERDRERTMLLDSEREARTAAEDAEQRYREVVAGIDAIVWEAMVEPIRATFVSERAVTLLGYPLVWWTDWPDPWARLAHPDDRASVVGRRSAAVAARVDYGIEYRAVTVDGRIIWLRDIVQLARDDTGRIERLRGVTVDITTRRLAETRREAQHAVARVLSESRTLAEAAPGVLRSIGESLDWDWGAIWQLDETNGSLRWLEEWQPPAVDAPAFAEASRQITFAPGAGLPGRVWATGKPLWISDITANPEFRRLKVAAREGLRTAFGVPLVGQGGVLGVMEFLSRSVSERDDEILGLVELIGEQIGQFIERRRAEAEVQASEARKAAIIAGALDCIITMDDRGRIVEFNPAAERTFGHRREDVVGQIMADLIIPPNLRAGHARGLGRFLETGEGPLLGRRVEVSALRADGTEFPVELAVVPVGEGADRVFTGYLRDITERRRAEQTRRFVAEAGEALAGSLDYEETLARAGRLAVPFLADWCTVYALEADGSVRRAVVVTDDPIRQELARQLESYSPTANAPSSRVAEVIRTGQSDLRPEIPEEYVDTISQGQEHTELLRALRFTSSIVVALNGRERTLGALSLFSTGGRHFGAADLALAEDLARRVTVALDNALLYRQAREAVQARDEFLSVAAHELKTPITSLKGYAQMTARQVEQNGTIEPGRLARALQVVDEQAGKLTRLITRLLDVARIDTGRLILEPTETDLTTLVESAVANARLNAPGRAIRVAAPASLIAEIDPLRIEQVLVNLLDNAIRYTPSGTPIDVSLVPADPDRVEIAVTDCGDGVPVEHRAHIFDRFHQAHASAHASGMGLGLYISRQIVEQHGGQVEAQFPPDGGTRFVVTLPVHAIARRAIGPPTAQD